MVTASIRVLYWPGMVMTANSYQIYSHVRFGSLKSMLELRRTARIDLSATIPCGKTAFGKH